MSAALNESVARLMLFIALLFADVPSAAANTLIRPGFRAVLASQDDSDLTFGGKFAKNFVSGSCSTNVYVESTCDDLPGTLVTDDTSSTVINGDALAVCNRYRHTSVCTSCSAFGIQTDCSQTTSDSYGGSFATYNLVSSPGDTASLRADDNDPNLSYCSGVCTDQATGNLVFPNEDKNQCTLAGGWIAVNSDYADNCAVQQTCEELEVIQGCEDTYTGSIAGTYRPLDTVDLDSCSSDVDTTRTVYRGSRGYIMYHASQKDWRFNSLGCSLLPPTRAEWEAGDEPYLNADSETECYDGGYGSDKKYDWTPFSIRCNKLVGDTSTNGGSNSGTGSGDSGGIFYSSTSSGTHRKVHTIVAFALAMMCAIHTATFLSC